MGSIPFGATTAILRHLLDDTRSGLVRADLVVQWEVARKRAAMPPTTLLSTTWAPWWSFDVGRRIPASAFRPVPMVDAAVLRVTRRTPPLLPEHMAGAYASLRPPGVAVASRFRMEETWSVPDVYLLTEGSEGTVAVPDLTLTFLDTGVALDKADGDHVWSSPWDQLEEMSPVEPLRAPRRSLRVSSSSSSSVRGRREHRFVLAADEPAETEATIRRRAAAHGLRTNRRAGRRSPRR